MSDTVRQRSIELKDFSGGLNNYWDPSSIADNEVPYLLNMEFTPNGALTSRPPIVDRGLGHPTNPATEKINLLGYYTPENGAIYLVASTLTKTWIKEVQQNGFGNWIEVWNQPAVAFVQYANQIVMGKVTAGGARWKVGDTSATAISTMPAIHTLALFRERMFATGVHGTDKETALYWSDVISLDQPTGIYEWSADSFSYVGRGDGQPLTQIVADYNGIILFKRNSTYNFVYSDLPEEGTVSLVQHNIGAQNRRSVAGYQNGFVVLHNRTLYKFQNNVYAPINSLKVRFNYKDIVSIGGVLFGEAVSIFGDRALVYTSGSLYTLNLQTGTWSQWETATNLAYVLEVPKPRGYTVSVASALGTSATSAEKVWFIQDSPISKWKELDTNTFEIIETGGSEVFNCVMRTKIYDFDTPTEWKRLYWWSADVAAAGTVTGKLIPIGIFDVENTWDQLEQNTWDYLEQQTWDNLFFRDAAVVTNQAISNIYKPQRVALKMDKSARFRRAYFELYLTCNGTEETAPAQIFSLTPMIGIKAKMSKDVA